MDLILKGRCIILENYANLMTSILTAAKKADEDYLNEIYAVIDNRKFFSSAISRKQNGFIATTTKDNMLIVQLNILGKPEVNSYPLSGIKKVKLSGPSLIGTYRVKMTFEIEKKKKKCSFTAAKNVHALGLIKQENNLEKLICELRKWSDTLM